MMKSRIKKQMDWKLFFGLFWFLLLLIIIVLASCKNKGKNEKYLGYLDYKIGVVADDGVVMVSISKQRRMINVLNLGKDVNLWISRFGWWRSNVEIKKSLDGEEKISLAKEMFWYNFGFWPDKILFLNSTNQWNESSVLIKNWGLVDWLVYKWNYGKMFLKQEKIDGNLKENGLQLDEIMMRDFSESRLSEEDLRISVFNNTSESGLANFMSKRLEWAGFSVVGADNNSDKVDKCLMVSGNKADLTYGWRMMNDIFGCEKRKSDILNENEMEIYFGDKLATMIKYSSYFK